MHSREDGSPTQSSRFPATRGSRRAVRVVVASLLAGAAVVSCSDKAPTSSATVPTHDASLVPSEVSAALIPNPGGVTVQVLSRSTFVDDLVATLRLSLPHRKEVVHVKDPSEVIVAKITVQPGGSFGWHTHHGPVFVTLAAGELSIVHAGDCAYQRYTAGQAFVDPGQGHVHVGYNASSTETVIYATFLGVPPGQGPTIPVQGPSCSSS